MRLWSPTTFISLLNDSLNSEEIDIKSSCFMTYDPQLVQGLSWLLPRSVIKEFDVKRLQQWTGAHQAAAFWPLLAPGAWFCLAPPQTSWPVVFLLFFFFFSRSVCYPPASSRLPYGGRRLPHPLPQLSWQTRISWTVTSGNQHDLHKRGEGVAAAGISGSKARRTMSRRGR